MSGLLFKTVVKKALLTHWVFGVPGPESERQDNTMLFRAL